MNKNKDKDDAVHLQYKLGRILGEGSFSVVKIGVCRADKSQWAVKVPLYIYFTRKMF